MTLQVPILKWCFTVLPHSFSTACYHVHPFSGVFVGSNGRHETCDSAAGIGPI